MKKLTNTDMDQLEKWIGTGPKTFKLLYSITQDGCIGQSFHTKCNNKGPTVTVLYNQQGSVYGGYTSVEWKNTNTYQQDASAFLFKLRFNGNKSATKFDRKGSIYDIYDHQNYGPTFGHGHDLLTFNTTINTSGGYFQLNGSMNLGNAFNDQGLSAAQINNGNMNVTELEVYKVSDGQREPEGPWRQTPTWNNQLLNELVKDITEYKGNPYVDITEANVLLIGPVGAGKSSFCNTVSSIVRGRITQIAGSGSAEHSLTTLYKQYRVRSQNGTVLNFRLCDTRGLEENQGIDIFELSFLLEGNVPDFYQFNPAAPINQDSVGFIKHPSVADKMHCVAFVVDVSTIDVVPASVLQKMKSFQTMIHQRGIPQVVLLSQVDKLSTDVKSNISTAFYDDQVRDEVEKAAQVFGLPCTNILPVKNYENAIQLDDNVNILALLALRQILNFAGDYMEYLVGKVLADSKARKKESKE